MPDPYITPDILLKAYEVGIFPMSEGADDPGLFWVEPKQRGIIPLDGFHISKRLVRTIQSGLFHVRINYSFLKTLESCANPDKGREDTWINNRIKNLYLELHKSGHCHSLEVYYNNELAGGLYGVCLKGAFFGESMFHNVRDASKVALVHLVAYLKKGGFTLLDTQFVTPHLAQFGAVEISKKIYKKRLEEAMTIDAKWPKTALNADEVLKILQGEPA